MMQIKVAEIVMKKRIRKNLGDLSSLMESMKRYGLINPILITRDNELIAGHRRLESAKRLGWDKVEVRIVNQDDEIAQIEMEIDENIQRKNLSTDELAEGYMRLERLKNPGFFRKIWNAIKNFFKRLFRMG
jgi:ParB family chromosome partitioning protein